MGDWVFLQVGFPHTWTYGVARFVGWDRVLPDGIWQYPVMGEQRGL